ncbi:putative latrophilin-3-like [Penaeus vannamei]|uniref:Putative latrophilin-3-like n=1 Tax=Penaeus vannamei TaxID=6689 RepID=A0A3R7QQ30_PENVA|nr:putative latrophilin-3-like [Penaeus vannamei]
MCVGYLAPFSYVSLTLAFTHAEGYATRKACWLSPYGVLWTFAGPLAIIMLINAVAYFMTMQVAWRENALIANKTYIMAGIFTFLNSMQGIVIFVFHIAINTPITQEVKRILK